MGFLVRAINPGVFGLYREPGAEFEIQEEKQFSKKWMEKIEDEDQDEEEVVSVKAKKKMKAKAESSESKSDASEDVI